MVETRSGLLPFLTRIGSHAHANELRELAVVSNRHRRTLYRWFKRLGEGVTFYPNIAYGALGLVHLHAFIDDPTPRLLRFPYAADAAWATSHPGGCTLYLHCLIPAGHEERIRKSLARFAACSTTIVTGDGWQDNELTATSRRRNAAPLPRIVPAPRVVLERAYPLLVPVATEVLGRRLSMRDLWTRLYEQMGERIWRYLPPGTRRWRRNGKAYVRHALGLLSRYGLVRQYVVRFAPLHEHTMEVLFLARSIADIEPLRAYTPLLEYFPGKDAVVGRGHGSIDFLKALLTNEGITAWWIINETRPVTTRVQVEKLFDPATGWQVAS